MKIHLVLLKNPSTVFFYAFRKYEFFMTFAVRLLVAVVMSSPLAVAEKSSFKLDFMIFWLN